MPITWTLDTTWRHTAALLWAAFGLMLLAGAAWAGWLFGVHSQVARAARVDITQEQALYAASARTAAAQDIAFAATRRAAAAQRRWRLAQAELRELRAAAVPLDTATGAPLGCTADEGLPQ